LAERSKRGWSPAWLVAPAVIVLAAAVLYPIGFNLFAALHRWNLLETDLPERFVGFATLAEVLADPRVHWSMGVTMALTACAVALEFALGLALALLVHEEIHAGRFFRTLLVAPIMATPLVVALVFRLMWHGEFGIINWFIGLVGLGPFVWLAQPGTAFLAILVTEVWHNTAFCFLVLLGAMQVLPRDPYEAAEVDGASWLQRLWHITIPLLRPAILVVLLFRTVFAIRLFDEVWVLTRGGPGSATETVSILLYRAAFEEFDVSRAGALSILLLLATSLLAFVLVRTLYRSEKLA
jgi:multiple sugar transport system permease protein